MKLIKDILKDAAFMLLAIIFMTFIVTMVFTPLFLYKLTDDKLWLLLMLITLPLGLSIATNVLTWMSK